MKSLVHKDPQSSESGVDRKSLLQTSWHKRSVDGIRAVVLILVAVPFLANGEASKEEIVVVNNGDTHHKKSPTLTRVAQPSLVFTSIAQGATPGGQDGQPSLRIIGEERQRTELAARVNVPDRRKLDAVDLSRDLIIATFQGVQRSSGYQIEIVSLEATGEMLSAKVAFSSPAPTNPVRLGFETPYHLVKIPRVALNVERVSAYQLRDPWGGLLREDVVVRSLTR